MHRDEQLTNPNGDPKNSNEVTPSLLNPEGADMDSPAMHAMMDPSMYSLNLMKLDENHTGRIAGVTHGTQN